jgi:hypothetical protein
VGNFRDRKWGFLAIVDKYFLSHDAADALHEANVP